MYLHLLLQIAFERRRGTGEEGGWWTHHPRGYMRSSNANLIWNALRCGEFVDLRFHIGLGPLSFIRFGRCAPFAEERAG